jgi:hypothetical protein
VPQQQDLFADAGPVIRAEPVLMALYAEYYELIWQGRKTHEFRRRFLEGRATRWFVYLNAPANCVSTSIDRSSDRKAAWRHVVHCGASSPLG